MLETKAQLAEKDLESHVERLENDLTKIQSLELNEKTRREMGAFIDSEQFMLIGYISRWRK